MEHPGIVTVLDVGREDDRWYIVSQFIDGETLEARLKREPKLSPLESAGLVAQVARAVHHAHGNGVVHRDIKPSNILLDQQGVPHLADFGLAVTETEQLDESPSTLGTFAYMSPEQVRGSSHLVDGPFRSLQPGRGPLSNADRAHAVRGSESFGVGTADSVPPRSPVANSGRLDPSAFGGDLPHMPEKGPGGAVPHSGRPGE